MRININYADIKSNVGKVLGMTMPSGRQVYIQRNMTRRRTFEVMVHELTHAALINLNIKCSKKVHEYIAKRVGKTALQVAKQKRVL